MLIVGGALGDDFSGMSTSQLESRFEALRQTARGLRQRMEQTRDQMKIHDKKFQEGMSRENRNEYEAKQKRYKKAEHSLKKEYTNAMDEAKDIREVLLSRRDPRAAAEEGSGLMTGSGKKGIPQRGSTTSKASKAIEDFDRLNTREQRDALQHFGRVVRNYDEASRFVKKADRKLDKIMDELNIQDSTDFYRSMRPKIEELEFDKKKALNVMRELKDEYRKAKKYLDTEMTTLMPSIEEADEPDPRAAAEEGSGMRVGRGYSLPVLAMEGKNDEDASYESIMGRGVSFSRQARVAPAVDTQRQTGQDDDRGAALDDAQEEMMGIPETFDDTVSTTGSTGSFDSFEDFQRRQQNVPQGNRLLYFLGR